MRKAIIYVFSGTGNTQRVCEAFKAQFEKNEVETAIYPIAKGSEDAPNPNDFELVGFAYPVHAFNAPVNVLDFARKLPKVQGKKYFVLKSSGEPLKLNNISSLKLNSILKKKGFVAGSEYHYAMPYNMIFRHTDAMTVKMKNAMEGLAPIEANEILNGVEHKLSRVPFGRLIAWIFRIEHPAMKVNGRFFKVDESKCVGCGLCAKNCPQHNIIIDANGKIKFSGDCIMCTRCSFFCPMDAFSIGMLNGWRVNGKYTYKLPEKEEKDKHAWYCKKAYARYFANAEKKIADSNSDNGVQ